MKNIFFVSILLALVQLAVADNEFTTNLNMNAHTITNVSTVFTSNITAYCFKDAKGNIITDFGVLTANIYPILISNIAKGLDLQLSNWVETVVVDLVTYIDVGVDGSSNYTYILVNDLSNRMDRMDAGKVSKSGDTMSGSLITSDRFVVAGVDVSTNLTIGVSAGSIGFLAKCGGVFQGGLLFDGKQWELSFASLGPFTSPSAVVPRSYIDSGLGKVSNYTAQVAVGLTNYIDSGLANTGDFMRIQPLQATENVAITNSEGSTITTLIFTNGVYLGHQ